MKLSTAQIRTTLFRNDFVLEPTVRIAQEYLRFVEQKYYPRRLFDFDGITVCKLCDTGDMEYMEMSEVLNDINHYLCDNEYFIIMWTDDSNNDMSVIFEAINRKLYDRYDYKIRSWNERRVYWPFGK